MYYIINLMVTTIRLVREIINGHYGAIIFIILVPSQDCILLYHAIVAKYPNSDINDRIYSIIT